MVEKKTKNLKIQPQSIEAEQAVLGSMLTSIDAVNRAQEILTSDSFYVEAHKKIFEVMIELFNNNEPIDVLSVDNKLQKNNQIDSVGGSYFITGLPDLVPSTANIEYYAKIVLEKASLRKLIDISSEINLEAYNNNIDFEDILDLSEQKIFSLSQGRIKNKFQPLKPILQKSFERLDEISKNPGSVTGVPSGLKDLDKLTSGFQPGELVIVAGRPSMGKTALALTFARNAAVDYQLPIGIFSLEMSNDALAMRLLTAESRVDSHLVRSGILPKEQWRNLSMSVGSLADAPIFLDDTPAMGITELRAKSRRLKSEKDVKLIVVDYLQLMKGPYNVESRQQEISQISQSLKALAKEIEVPVLALSQLSRAPEARSDHRPVLSDLRESGAIEQDADLVMFLYRKWIYSRDDEDKRKAEIIISKQRNGPTGTVNATFIDNYAKFENTSLIDIPSKT